MAGLLCASVIPAMAFGALDRGNPVSAKPSDSRVVKYGKSTRTQSASSRPSLAGAESSTDYVPGEILVRFSASVGASARSSTHRTAGSLGAKQLRGVPGVEKVSLARGISVEDAVARYEEMPGVVSAQPNYLYHLASMPDDPYFGELWGMHNEGQTGGTEDADIDALEAWDIETGNGEVIVAVIDTGVDYNHPDLAPNIWVNEGEIPGNGIDDDGNGYIDDVHGYDFANYDGDPMDDNAHGTHCAGTIGAVGDNGIGVAGVAWNVKIMPIKFLTADGWGTTEGAIEAIAYADMMGAHVLSNSWGGGWYDQLLYDTIDAVEGLFVAAAGNDMANTDVMPFYPAGYELDNILSVGATDHDDNVAWFSNFGEKSVDVFAPGDMILSTVPGAPPKFVPDMGDTIMIDDLSSLDDWDTSEYNYNSWELSEEVYTSAPSSAAHIGYVNDEDSWLIRTVPVDLSAVSGAVLRFQAQYDLETGFDELRAHVSTNGADWQGVGSVTGWSGGGFEEQYFDVSTVAGQSEVYIAFSLSSDGSIDSSDGFVGAWIDDIEIVEAEILFSDSLDDLGNWDATEYAVNPWTPSSDWYASPPSAAANVNYANNENSWLKLATPIDLSGVGGSEIALRFKSLYDIEWGFDVFHVWASTDGTEWDHLAEYTGWTWEWFGETAVGLSDYAGESEVFLAFSLTSDEVIGGDWGYLGVIIDDVSVAAGSWSEPQYENAYDSFSGTSMATPHVAGLAALSLSNKPDLSTDLVKWSIMETVDVLPSLSGKAATAGRINAHSAMLDHWAPTISIDATSTYQATATINITATDDTAVEHITYRFDNGPWVRVEAETAEAVFSIPGARTMTYFASDVLGNETQADTIEFRIVRGDVSYVSIAGANRYLTAVEASKKAFPNGAKAVVMATGTTWPDALGGAALAGVAGGPVLLTPAQSLPGAVAEEIARLAPEKVFILGGTAAVSEDVAMALASEVGTATIERIAGSNRYDTARQIADKVISLQGDDYDGMAFVATGRNFPDALAASPIAAAKGWPILLAGASSGSLYLPEQVSSVAILGGSNAVGDGLQAGLETLLGEAQVVRRGGANRYGTAALVASFGVNRGMYWEGVGVATGTNFPDALSGGAMLGSMNTVLLLTPGASLASDARAPLMLNKEFVQTVDYLGGLNALSQSVRDQVKTAVE